MRADISLDTQYAGLPWSEVGAKPGAATSSPPSCAGGMAGRTQHLTSPDQVPEGLTKTDWASIRTAYEAGRYAFLPIEGGWQARNPGQQWTTRFDGHGFLATPRDGGWQWGLELQSYGFAGAMREVRAVSRVTAVGQRLAYQWDADGRVLTSHFEAAEENAVRLLVDERGARYPLTIDPIAQQAYLKASNTEQSPGVNDNFGNSVAISGDTGVVEFSTPIGVEPGWFLYAAPAP